MEGLHSKHFKFNFRITFFKFQTWDQLLGTYLHITKLSLNIGIILLLINIRSKHVVTLMVTLGVKGVMTLCDMGWYSPDQLPRWGFRGSHKSDGLQYSLLASWGYYKVIWNKKYIKNYII